MVDNFEQLNSLLKFESDDDFYMLQIIKRRKENPDVDCQQFLENLIKSMKNR